MTAVPDYEETLDDVKAALKVICQTITPNVDAEPYVTWKRAAPPLWTMFFQRTVPTDNGTGEWRFDESVILTCHVGYATEPTIDTEMEAQRVKMAATIEFLQRPFLQSDTVDYQRGVDAIHPQGVIVREVSIVAGGVPEKQTMAVQVSLTIPLLFQLDSVDY